MPGVFRKNNPITKPAITPTPNESLDDESSGELGSFSGSVEFILFTSGSSLVHGSCTSQ